jgi:hypothetical protein
MYPADYNLLTFRRRRMDFSLYRSKPGEKSEGNTGNAAFPLASSCRRGAQVASQQSPILRAADNTLQSLPHIGKSSIYALKHMVKMLLLLYKSVTYVLTLKCYLCLDTEVLPMS